jgi:hypothetical protein
LWTGAKASFTLTVPHAIELAMKSAIEWCVLDLVGKGKGPGGVLFGDHLRLFFHYILQSDTFMRALQQHLF